MENLQQSHDVVEGVPSRVIGVLWDIAERLTATSIGQSLLRRADKALWVVEKSAQWSVPIVPVDKTQPAKLGTFPELVRPLPWAIFLPALIFFRVARASLSICAVSIGKDSIEPIDVVRYIQNRRRRLRAAKFLGLRTMRMRNQSKEDLSKKRGYFASLLAPISGLLCTRRESEVAAISIVHTKQKSTKGYCDLDATDKRKFKQMDQSDDDEDFEDYEDYNNTENLIDMVHRMAAMSDTEDPDYEIGNDRTVDLSEEETDDDEKLIGSGCGSVSEQVIREENESDITKYEETQQKDDNKVTNHVPFIINDEQVDEILKKLEKEKAELIQPPPAPPLPEKKPVDTKIKVSPKIDSATFINAEKKSYIEPTLDFGNALSLEVSNKSSPCSDEQFFSPVSSTCVTPEPTMVQIQNSEVLSDAEKTPTNQSPVRLAKAQIPETEGQDSLLNMSASSDHSQMSSPESDTITGCLSEHDLNNQIKQKKANIKTHTKNHKHSGKINSNKK